MKKCLMKTGAKLPFRIGHFIFSFGNIPIQVKLKADRCFSVISVFLTPPPFAIWWRLSQKETAMIAQGYKVFWIHLYEYVSVYGFQKRCMGIYSLHCPFSNLLEMYCKLSSVMSRFGYGLLF